MADFFVTGVTPVVGAKASVNDDDKNDDDKDDDGIEGAVVVIALDGNDAAENEDDGAVNRVDDVGVVLPDKT